VNGAPLAKLVVRALSAWYGGARRRIALEGVSLDVPAGSVLALIGPSGCGKTTLLRCLNRMHELGAGCGAEGSVLLDGEDIYASEMDPVWLRRRVGMLFQQPVIFPTLSVRGNVLVGARLAGLVSDEEALLESTLLRASLWDEIKDRLDDDARSLSGGQQQRLCLARALAVEPEVLLLDEPTAGLDPVATARLEELLCALKEQYTVVLVTHNLQQALRTSDLTALLLGGRLVEVGPTTRLFTHPERRETEDYVTGKFGD
jgi:phosphate transport system ATP-binding protein